MTRRQRRTAATKYRAGFRDAIEVTDRPPTTHDRAGSPFEAAGSCPATGGGPSGRWYMTPDGARAWVADWRRRNPGREPAADEAAQAARIAQQVKDHAALGWLPQGFPVTTWPDARVLVDAEPDQPYAASSPSSATNDDSLK